MQAQQHASRGFVTLLSTLIVTVFGAVLALSLLTRAGIGASTIEVLERSAHARYFADACAEMALLDMADDGEATSAGNLSFELGGCEYITFDDEIASVGEAGASTRRVRVLVELNEPDPETGAVSGIDSIYWQEVPDF